MDKNFICSQCHKVVTSGTGISAGYARDDHGNKICYQCCGEIDKKYMMENDSITLYLNVTKQDGRYFEGEVINWPGTIKAKVGGRIGRHNFARIRYDAYFAFDNAVWHGVTYGNNTQICHCKKTKSKDFYGLATLK